MSQPSIEGETSPHYRTVIAGQIFCGLRNGNFEFEFISENINLQPSLGTPAIDAAKATIKRTLEVKLVVSPISLKSWIPYFQAQIDQYESIFGPITLQAQTGGPVNPNKGTSSGAIGSQYS